MIHGIIDIYDLDKGERACCVFVGLECKKLHLTPSKHSGDPNWYVTFGKELLISNPDKNIAESFYNRTRDLYKEKGTM
jgi:hypothetical protein